MKRHLAARQITVITGMRRTGKTTLMKQLLAQAPSKNFLYIDLERLDNRELFSEKNYDAILTALAARGLSTKEKMYVGIDELQLAPQAPSVLKYLYDNYPVKFIATGSSSYYLKNLFAESLAGRKKIFELYPLDFGEFLTFKGIAWREEAWADKMFDPHEYERTKQYYEEFIAYGGFPEVVLTPDIQTKKDLAADIVSSYVNIDISQLADLKNHDHIYALMKMLAARVGTKLDMAKLSRLIGVSRPTVTSYVTFLEKTYFLYRVPVIANRPDREIVKAKKVYLCDTGIAGALAQLDGGAQFENALYTQLRHHGDISYFALKSGNEIDYVLNKTYALEAKESPSDFDIRSLDGLADQARIPHRRLIGRRPVPGMTNFIWGGSIR